MSYAEDRSSGNKTLLIVFGIIGGVLVLAILVCGGLAFFAIKTAGPAFQKGMQMFEDMAQGTATAQAFIENIRADRLEDAYKSTTDAFQKRMSQKAFEELVHQYPALRQVGTFDNPNLNNPNPQTPFPVLTTQIYGYGIRTSDGKEVEARLTMVKEDTGFKVDQFTVEVLEPDKGQGAPTTSKAPRSTQEKAEEKNPKASPKKNPPDENE
jgi:hypothetical protein